MAVVKVFDCNGVKELSCFDTLLDVPYLLDEEDIAADEDIQAADDRVDF